MPNKNNTSGPIIDADTGTAETPTEGIALMPPMGDIITHDMAAAIRADVAIFHRHSRLAAFLAIRIGLRLVWIRDNGAHGDIGRFIETELKDQSRSTLNNYMNVAHRFAVDSGLLDKRTHRLENGKAVAPILSEQLELFADPEAKFEGALKKVVKWVADRGLSEIYNTLKAEKKQRTAPPTGTKVNTSEADRRAQAEKDAKATLSSFCQWYEGGMWKLLDDSDLDKLRALGAKFQIEAPAIVKGRNKGGLAR